MISREHRFHGHNSLRFVYQRGSSVRGTLCSLKFVENRRRTTYRTAVVVSKKMHKSAVVRNRIRRRLYEIVRQTVDEKSAYDLVFTVFSPDLADMPAPNVQGEVEDLLSRARIRSRQSVLRVEAIETPKTGQI